MPNVIAVPSSLRLNSSIIHYLYLNKTVENSEDRATSAVQQLENEAKNLIPNFKGQHFAPAVDFPGLRKDRRFGALFYEVFAYMDGLFVSI